MSDTIKILEDRVRRAVARIRELRNERSELERELERTRARLEAAAGDDNDGATENGWRREREQVVSALRDVVVDLRGD